MHNAHKQQCITLIGMPGAGKSSVGALLATEMGKSFIDTDRLIEAQKDTTLQHIADTEGYVLLRAIEAELITGLRLVNTVIATGGSAIYSDGAMANLRDAGTLVYLHCDLEVLEQRIDNYDSRGLAKPPEQSFAALFEERMPLYRRAASHEIDTSRFDEKTVASEIQALLAPPE